MHYTRIWKYVSVTYFCSCLSYSTPAAPPHRFSVAYFTVIVMFLFLISLQWLLHYYFTAYKSDLCSRDNLQLIKIPLRPLEATTPLFYFPLQKALGVCGWWPIVAIALAVTYMKERVESLIYQLKGIPKYPFFFLEHTNSIYLATFSVHEGMKLLNSSMLKLS